MLLWIPIALVAVLYVSARWSTANRLMADPSFFDQYPEALAAQLGESPFEAAGTLRMQACFMCGAVLAIVLGRRFRPLGIAGVVLALHLLASAVRPSL